MHLLHASNIQHRCYNQFTRPVHVSSCFDLFNYHFTKCTRCSVGIAADHITSAAIPSNIDSQSGFSVPRAVCNCLVFELHYRPQLGVHSCWARETYSILGTGVHPKY